MNAAKKLPLEAWLNGAITAAHAAGEVIKKYYLKPEKSLKIIEKSEGRGLVTRADFEAESAAIKVLKKTAPHFDWVTEESNPELNSPTEFAWVLDPLDGTTNFVHKFPMFCVTIAVLHHGEPLVGVTYHPILDETYFTVRGKGAFVVHGQSRKKSRLRISERSVLADAVLATGFAAPKRHLIHTEISMFEKISKKVRAVRRPGSAALDLAYTARVVFDGFWERHLSAWDVAAGALLVQEAGGIVTTLSGGKFSPFGAEILATNPALHHPIRRLTR